MPDDDHALACELAAEAGRRLLELRALGGDQDVLRKAGDRLSHEFLMMPDILVCLSAVAGALLQAIGEVTNAL